jgi:hypothetical protein
METLYDSLRAWESLVVAEKRGARGETENLSALWERQAQGEKATAQQTGETSGQRARFSAVNGS